LADDDDDDPSVASMPPGDFAAVAKLDPQKIIPIPTVAINASRKALAEAVKQRVLP
jgi:hypothetical protein